MYMHVHVYVVKLVKYSPPPPSSPADGSCFIWKTDDCSTQKSVTKLTGPELDTVSCVKNVMNDIYTSCRDGCVRVYSCIDVSI